jgi:glycosyltransferase involved in cell wall biosynthesis
MNQSFKIGLVAARALFEPTGVGEYTRNLLLALQPRIQELYCIGANGRVIPPQPPLPITSLSFKPPLGYGHKLLAPLRLRFQGFSLLHFMTESELYFIRPGSTKIVVTIHGCASNVLPPEMHEPMPRHVLLKYRYLLSRVDAIVTISEASKGDIVKVFRVPTEKVIVIYNGIAELFRRRALEAERPLWSVYERPFILSVGVTIPKKNMIGVLQALAILKSLGFSHRLIHIGPKGWGHDAILREVQYLGLHNDVEFKGYLPAEELMRYYEAAEVFVFPSFHEGFGIPILEAMACGCPVVASNCHSIPEVAGDAALLVDPYDSAKIANAIHLLLTNEQNRRKLIEKGRQRAQQFSWDRAADEVMALYQRLLIGQ